MYEHLEYLPPVEAAARLGISDTQLRDAVVLGHLKAYTIARMWPATVLPWKGPVTDPERLVRVTITGLWRISSHDDLCELTHAGSVARPHLKPVDDQAGREIHQARPDVYAWPDFWISTGRGVAIEWSDVRFREPELDALEPAPATAGMTSTPKGRKKLDSGTRLLAIIEALECWAADNGEDFNRSAMPGPLGEDWTDNGSFHWLCGQVDPAFRRAKKTFAKHREGICSLGRWANPTDFYRRALPAITPKLGAPINADHRPGKKISP